MAPTLPFLNVSLLKSPQVLFFQQFAGHANIIMSFMNIPTYFSSQFKQSFFFLLYFLLTSLFSHPHPPILSSNIIIWPTHPPRSLITQYLNGPYVGTYASCIIEYKSSIFQRQISIKIDIIDKTRRVENLLGY